MAEDASWRTFWVTDVPEAGAGHLWTQEELERRERAVGIRALSPFMINPDGTTDATMTAFFNDRKFARLAESTKRSYADDYRVFFNFLWGRGRLSWADAEDTDIYDYEDWRRRSLSNPRRIGGAKWNRELAALKRLYDWAVSKRVVSVSPLVMIERTRPDGTTHEELEARATDTRTANVKWLTPRMAKLWRDVGLLGLRPDGEPDPRFRGRNGDRNAAYFDLLFDSGLRRSEAGSLLTIEIEGSTESGRHVWGKLATAAAKNGSGRASGVSAVTAERIRAYVVTSRAKAVGEAQRAGSYELIGPRLILERHRMTARGWVLRWMDESTGEPSDVYLDDVGIRERMRLFAPVGDTVEPLWLWLSESGLPFLPHSWEGVFRGASARCSKVLGTRAPFCTPHMARHSFALIMLVAVFHAFDQRYGLTPEQRRDFWQLYNTPWRLVKDLLGHRSEETTREVYLSPVRDVEIRSLLDGDLEIGAGFLHALAAVDSRVQDITRD